MKSIKLVIINLILKILVLIKRIADGILFVLISHGYKNKLDILGRLVSCTKKYPTANDIIKRYATSEIINKKVNCVEGCLLHITCYNILTSSFETLEILLQNGANPNLVESYQQAYTSNPLDSSIKQAYTSNPLDSSIKQAYPLDLLINVYGSCPLKEAKLLLEYDATFNWWGTLYKIYHLVNNIILLNTKN